MASTHTELLYHCIWSTKHREPLIRPEIEEMIWSALAATARHNDMHAIRIGGVENHVHALLRIPKTMAISEAMKRMKGGSSKFINRESFMGNTGRFAWQDGYGAFTVSRSAIPGVVDYIASQREHHRVRTFEDEFVAFLEKHGIDYDADHLWG